MHLGTICSAACIPCALVATKGRPLFVAAANQTRVWGLGCLGGLQVRV